MRTARALLLCAAIALVASGGHGESQDEPETREYGVTTLLEEIRAHRVQLERRARELDDRERQVQELERIASARMTELEELADSVEQRIAEWEESNGDAVRQLAKIYSSMPPQRAAPLLEQMDVELATQLVAKMKYKDSASVLPNAPLLAELSFHYGELEVSARDARPTVIEWPGPTLLRRDMEREHELLVRLLECGVEPVPGSREHELELRPQRVPAAAEGQVERKPGGLQRRVREAGALRLPVWGQEAASAQVAWRSTPAGGSPGGRKRRQVIQPPAGCSSSTAEVVASAASARVLRLSVWIEPKPAISRPDSISSS